MTDDNLYVDNIISGCQSEEATLHYYQQARHIMGEAKLNLCSWASNSSQLQALSQADKGLDLNTMVNLLGLRWNTATDMISLTKRQVTSYAPIPVTKRNILQGASRLYDPLGWLLPITIRAKLLLQELWKKKVPWDEPLDHDTSHNWSHIATDVEEAAKVVLPRRYFDISSNQPIYLHVFADASKRAYGAVANLQNAAGNTTFVMAKSRVSPLKDHTLPRLELMAAVLATHLATFIVSTLHHHSA